MINFQTVSKKDFLQNYWQKQPLLIKNALPNFTGALDASDLAGLSMEEEVESKIVFELKTHSPSWQLKHGPFLESDFNQLPKSHWTLLVQGVDRLIPQVSHLLNDFDFLPQWRVDDVMISVAGMHGGVGPHFDNYDVFLYQASGQRKWSLTTQNCNEENALDNLELRIMADFDTEQEIILEEGDMLYLPPHVGHHGISLTDNSIGYSFGYRSYQSQELWDSFADHLSETKSTTHLYKDPNWNELKSTSEIPNSAFINAKALMQSLLEDDSKLQQWFSRFATQLDQQAVQLLPTPLTLEEAGTVEDFIETLKQSSQLERDLNARIAYHYDNKSCLCLFINGEAFNTHQAEEALIKLIACQRTIQTSELTSLLKEKNNRLFLYELWKEQFLDFS